MASGPTTFSKRKQQQQQQQLGNHYQMAAFEGGQNESQEETTKEVDDQQKRDLSQLLLSATNSMDAIEAGLAQRLERCNLAGVEKPSDKVTQLLVNEHVRALDVSFQQQVHTNQTTGTVATKKVRHVQVQTMAIEQDKQQKPPAIKITSFLPRQQLPLLSLSKDSSSSSPSSSSSSVSGSGSQFPSPVSDSGVGVDDNEITTTATTITTCSQATIIDRLEKELAGEKKQRQRVEASLNDTRDHFEVLSGLAYKKLREIWEEKLKWENACMELNQQLMITQQQQQQQREGKEQNHQGSDDNQDIDSVTGKDSISVVS
ncbi:hypothetical protein BCR42DRAFT_407917 [Absidia repens]|uniref:Uncharacterized protein n=1 Tax=Absidia repens TaxID=90262 RepID=A0A1X2ISY5_9FUNG|nr:hypothetical protein BCR42DRAFT_407917 [Absidia repens]